MERQQLVIQNSTRRREPVVVVPVKNKEYNGALSYDRTTPTRPQICAYSPSTCFKKHTSFVHSLQP
eukprot:7938021-Alexandrium_andersonii.AAC.1